MGHIFGDSRSQMEIPLAAIYENPPGWIWKRSPVDHFNLWMALEGQGTIDLDGESYPFAAGSIFLFPPTACPFGMTSGNLRMINFTAHIKAQGKAAGILSRIARQASPVKLRHFIWAAHLCRYLSEAFYLKSKESQKIVLSGLELLLESMHFEKSLPPADPVNDLLMQSVERIRRNPAAAYTVSEMAAATRLSSAQFTRRFKSITGLTPNRFILEERLGWAESYLRETDMNIQEIASRLGYGDVYFFSRQFRRFRGVPPTALRKG